MVVWESPILKSKVELKSKVLEKQFYCFGGVSWVKYRCFYSGNSFCILKFSPPAPTEYQQCHHDWLFLLLTRFKADCWTVNTCSQEVAANALPSLHSLRCQEVAGSGSDETFNYKYVSVTKSCQTRLIKRYVCCVFFTCEINPLRIEILKFVLGVVLVRFSGSTESSYWPGWDML